MPLPENVTRQLTGLGIKEACVEKASLYYDMTRDKGQEWYDEASSGRALAKYIRKTVKYTTDETARQRGDNFIKAVKARKPSTWQDAITQFSAALWAVGYSGIQVREEDMNRLAEACGAPIR